jgi:hypothetical protein
VIWCGRVRRQCALCDKPTSNCPAFCCAMAITYKRPAWDADAPTMAGRPALRQHEGAGVRSEHRLVAAGREKPPARRPSKSLGNVARSGRTLSKSGTRRHAPNAPHDRHGRNTLGSLLPTRGQRDNACSATRMRQYDRPSELSRKTTPAES